MKTVGVSVSARDLSGYGVESSIIHSKEDGATINIFTGGLAVEMSVPQVDFMKVLVSVGVQTIYYEPTQKDGVSPGNTFSGGIYLAGGFSMALTSGMDFRSQLVMLNGPGRAALVEVGIEIPLGGSR